MLTKVFLPLAAVMIFIALLGLFNQGKLNLSFFQKPVITSTPLPQKTVKIGQTTINIEIVDTPEERKKGLSLRESLPQDSGMLFIFDTKPASTRFWMKDMKIPLDIIWIKDGKVLQIDKNVPIPAPGTPDSSLTIYSPHQPVDYVLEVNAGFSDANSLKANDPVDLTRI